MNIYDFLTWRYTKSHLSENKKDAIHCHYYALDVKNKVYNPHVCSECYTTFNVFPLFVKMLLTNVKDIIPEDNTIFKNEVDLMIESLPAFQKTVINYTSYKLRTSIQYNAMKLIMNELKNDASFVILVINHKQKIEHMRYREPQVEYHGKKGMILLGIIKLDMNIPL